MPFIGPGAKANHAVAVPYKDTAENDLTLYPL